MSNKPNFRLRTLRGKTPSAIFRRIATTTAVQEIAKSCTRGFGLNPDHHTLRRYIRSRLPDLGHTPAVNLAILSYFKDFTSLDQQVNKLSIAESSGIFGRICRAAEQDEKIYRNEYHAAQVEGATS